jgi:hypothetical protein
MVPRYVLRLYFVKNHKIAKSSTTTKAREKISTDLESIEHYNFLCMFVYLKNQILLYKISHSFILTTKLFTG